MVGSNPTALAFDGIYMWVANYGSNTVMMFNAATGAKGYLAGRIQKRYGVTREEAGQQVEQWSDALLDIVEASTTH